MGSFELVLSSIQHIVESFIMKLSGGGVCLVILFFVCSIKAQRGRFNNRRPGRRPGFGLRPGNGFIGSRPGNTNFGGLNSPTQLSRPASGNGGFNFPSGGFSSNNGNNNNNNQNNPCTDNNPATICITDIVSSNQPFNNNNLSTNNQNTNPCTDNNPFTVCITDISNNQPSDPCSDNNPATICITNVVPGPGLNPGVRSQAG